MNAREEIETREDALNELVDRLREFQGQELRGRIAHLMKEVLQPMTVRMLVRRLIDALASDDELTWQWAAEALKAVGSAAGLDISMCMVMDRDTRLCR